MADDKVTVFTQKLHSHLAPEGVTKEDSVKFYEDVADIVRELSHINSKICIWELNISF